MRLRLIAAALAAVALTACGGGKPDAKQVSFGWDCKDGRELHLSGEGWWFDDGPVQPLVEGADNGIPSDVFWHDCMQEAG